MRGAALRQPLITRPAYGTAGQGTVAQSALPEGGPAGKGLPLDSGIPGSSTHNKDEDSFRDPDKHDDDSVHSVDNADDLLSDRGRIDFSEDNSGNHDGVRPWNDGGNADWEDATSKTKYPYRTRTKKASAEYVLARWDAEQCPAQRVDAGKRTKIALRLSGIVDGLNPLVEQRGSSCSVTLKRADPKNLRWILAVDCQKGGGPRVVKIKGARDSRVTNLAKMDLDLSCSCPAWRWQGPEHHSKREDYLDGKPRGTASVPVIRDPDNINRVCKHMSAALNFVKDWNVEPRSTKKRKKRKEI